MTDMPDSNEIIYIANIPPSSSFCPGCERENYKSYTWINIVTKSIWTAQYGRGNSSAWKWCGWKFAAKDLKTVNPAEDGQYSDYIELAYHIYSIMGLT